MKNAFSFVFVCVFLAITVAPAQSISLLQAVKSAQISASFHGAVSSPHYLRPLTGEIKNRTDKEISIQIPAGYHFRSSDSAVQDIITTNEEIFVLQANEVRQIEIGGMCIQHSNRAPGEADAFEFAGWARQNLKEMAEEINVLKSWSYQGQRAMWVVSDNDNLENIFNGNMKTDVPLMEKAAALSGQKMLSAAELESLQKQKLNGGHKAELRGEFSFRFSRKVPIHIAIFDEDGIVLQEIYQQMAPAGRQKVTYTFDAFPYQGQTIHAKLIAQDDVLIDRKIVL